MSRMRPQRSCRVFWRLNNKFLSLVSRSRYRLVWDRNSKRKNMYRMYLYKYRIYHFYIYWGFFNAVPWNGFAPSHTVFHWQKLDHLIYEAYLINSLQWFIENSMFVYILIWKSHETSKLSSYTYRSITMGPPQLSLFFKLCLHVIKGYITKKRRPKLSIRQVLSPAWCIRSVTLILVILFY